MKEYPSTENLKHGATLTSTVMLAEIWDMIGDDKEGGG